MGINKIGAVPQKVANFLKLPNAKAYTGHCFRRSSATILVDAGGDILTLKRHGGWRSSSTAEGYLEDSLQQKKQTAEMILTSVLPDPSLPSTSASRQSPNLLTRDTDGNGNY